MIAINLGRGSIKSREFSPGAYALEQKSGLAVVLAMLVTAEWGMPV